MMIDLGLLALVTAFAISLYAIGAAAWGGVERKPAWVASARNAGLAVFPLVLFAAGTLVYSMLANDYTLEYAASVSSRATPTFLKITALWGGQNGSILFWSLLMSMFIFALMWTARGDRMFLAGGGQVAPLLPWAIVVTMITQAFFLGLSLFMANPFARLWQLSTGDVVGAVFQPVGALPFVPLDGNGLNPLLRHPGMIIHPPMLYLGFTGFTIPFAFAMAALIAGRSDDAWLRQTRRWTLTAWLFLSLGLGLGARWAYDVLGWGGYWGWDAVENSSLLPWLTGTAFLHSVMIQERRGMFKAWNMVLIVLTYALVILGTFITRTGIVSSVHAFARSSIGPPFLAYVGLTLLGAVGLIVWRWDRLRSQNELDSWLSRESAFLAQNVVFLLIAFTVAWGTYFPMVSELLTDNKLTVGAPWFNQWVGPQFAVLVVLMGVAPLIAWRKSAVQALGRLIWLPTAIAVVTVIIAVVLGVRHPAAIAGYLVCAFAALVTLFEYGRNVAARARAQREPIPTALWRLFGRNRRRYGGYMIHLGVVIIALGIISTTLFQQTTQGMLARGQSLHVAGYSLVYRGLEQMPQAAGDDQQTTVATLDLYEGSTYLATLSPQRDSYLNTGETMTPPAVLSTHVGTEDVYVILVGWEAAGENAATFKVYVNPLANFLWGGALVFVLGTLIAAWPNRREGLTWATDLAPQTAAAEGGRAN